MNLSKNVTVILVASIIVVGAVGSVALYSALNPNPGDNLDGDDLTVDTSVNITLLNNAGVMIETNDTRIYIDPYLLPDAYEAYPADIILVTHPHGDHYHYGTIEKIATEDTVFIMPENMSIEVARHDAIAVNPEDSVQVGDINITAFYSYTVPVTQGETVYEASHPAEANWTSFIIDINGFTIFHAGDTKDVPEFEQLEGLIDVAFIPLGPGCQTCYEGEVVNIVDMIKPKYFIGIHFTVGYNDEFETEFGSDIAAIDGCELINLDYWSSHVFQP
ncbi:MAG: MBL fold metallo-hydrolase [Candidatus Thorarchaeota archaeon]